MENFLHYIEKMVSGIKPIIAVIITVINYLLFPDQAFLTAFIAVGIVIVLDILTKYMAISKPAGGFRKAMATKKISSNSLWEGTKIKLFSYMIVFILAGLSFRVTMLSQVSVFLATIVYSIIFLREAQSILENLCEAGADLKWLIVWTKKKQEQILDSDKDRYNKEGYDDYDRFI